MFVQFYAVKEVNTSTENVNAILVGKAKNVNCGMMNAKYLIVTDTGIVLTENAAASGVTRESFVKRVSLNPLTTNNSVSHSNVVSFLFCNSSGFSAQLIAHTLLVLVMDIAWKGLVFARKAGKALIVDRWTKRHCNAYQTVLDTDLMI